MDLNTGQGWRRRRGGLLPIVAWLLATLLCAAGAVAGWADRSATMDPAAAACPVGGGRRHD